MWVRDLRPTHVHSNIFCSSVDGNKRSLSPNAEPGCVGSVLPTFFAFDAMCVFFLWPAIYNLQDNFALSVTALAGSLCLSRLGKSEHRCQIYFHKAGINQTSNLD